MDVMTPLSAASCYAAPLVEIRAFLMILSFSFAAFSFLLLRRQVFTTRSRLFLIYTHLASLAFPPILFATHFGCIAMCLSCATSLTSLLALALPFTIGATALTGFVVIPTFFTYANRTRRMGGWMFSFVSRQTRRLGIGNPKIYLLDRAEPVAFSFRTVRSAIFLSVGLTELLNKKELQAVLLHELAHIAHKASVTKISELLLRFSPFSLLRSFSRSDDAEERRADAFAANAQGSSRWLNSAKRKIGEYNMKPKKDDKKPGCCC